MVSWSEVFVSTVIATMLSLGASITVHFLLIPVFALIQEGENSLVSRLIPHLVYLTIPVMIGWFLSKRLNSVEEKNFQAGLTAFFATIVQLIWILFIDLFVAAVWQ